MKVPLLTGSSALVAFKYQWFIFLNMNMNINMIYLIDMDNNFVSSDLICGLSIGEYPYINREMTESNQSLSPPHVVNKLIYIITAEYIQYIPYWVIWKLNIHGK